MSTLVIYNGIRLKDCQTQRFEQTIEYDRSNTDMIYQKFTVAVACLVYENRLHFAAADVGFNTANATDTLAAIHDRLLQPRQNFQYLNGGTLLLSATAQDGRVDTDLNNGPKPGPVEIEHVAALKAYRIKFTCEVAVVRCLQYGVPPGSGSGGAIGVRRNNNVLNNRWSLTETRDQSFRLIRSLEGYLRVSHHKLDPMSVRGLVVPPLQIKFRRVRQTFTRTADGLGLQYSITDQEETIAPPPPAVEWQVEKVSQLTVPTDINGGAGALARNESFTVFLKGSPTTPVKDLLPPAYRVMVDRLGALQKRFKPPGENDNSQILLSNAQLREMPNTPAIQLTCAVRVVLAPAEDRTVFGLDAKGVEDTYSHDTERWPSPFPWGGDSVVGAFALYLQHPCDDKKGITGVDYQPPAPISPGDQPSEGETTDYDQGDAPDYYDSNQSELTYDEPNPYDYGHSGGSPYHFAQIESFFQHDIGKAVLAFADPSRAANLPQVAVFPAHSQGVRRIINVRYERIGDWPKIPAPSDSFVDIEGIRQHLLDFTLSPSAPTLEADQRSRMFSIEAHYEYQLERTPTKYSAGAPPTDKSTVDENMITLADITSNEQV